MKFTAAKESYIKSCTATGKSPATIASYSATLEKFAAFIAEQGIEAAEDVRPMTIMGYIEQRSGEISATSLNLELTHLRCFFSWAEDMEIIDRSPVKKSIKVEKSALREAQNKEYDGIITDREFREIMQNNHPSNTHRAQYSRNAALLMVFLTTGLRNESVRELRVGDVDFVASRIRVSAAKGNKSGYAPLTDIARVALTRYLADHPALTADSYLFGFEKDGEWKPFSRQQMSNTVEAAIKSYLPERTGIRSHALRHSFASILASHGMEDREISLLLFHSDGTGAAVTRRYISDDLSWLFEKVNTVFNKVARRGIAAA